MKLLQILKARVKRLCSNSVPNCITSAFIIILCLVITCLAFGLRKHRRLSKNIEVFLTVKQVTEHEAHLEVHLPTSMASVSSSSTTESPKDTFSEDILKNHLTPYNPSLPTNYSGSRPSFAKHQKTQWKQSMSKLIAERLQYLGGFFVECGALDGAFISNTLLLEKQYSWTGLLVEADPLPLKILKQRNRHAWVADVCMSPKKQPMITEMTGHKDVIGHGYLKNDVIEKSRETTKKRDYNRKFTVQCYPFEMLMNAINRTDVHYFSLDVEGVELDILKTIDFNKFNIQLISVEVRPKNRKAIQEYMKKVGYIRIETVKIDAEFIHDDVYEKIPNDPSSVLDYK